MDIEKIKEIGKYLIFLTLIIGAIVGGFTNNNTVLIGCMIGLFVSYDVLL